MDRGALNAAQCRRDVASVVRASGRDRAQLINCSDVIRYEIIEAHDVIGVRMSENHGIDAADIFAQGLGAKIRSGIDDESGLRCFDVNGRTEAFIARVG